MFISRKRLTRITRLLFATVVLAAAPSMRAEPGDAKCEPRKIYAHYMGCFPAGSGPIYQHQFKDSEFREKFRHDGKSALNLKGGRFKTWPLVPELAKPLTVQESADLEIRRALRAGIDGFAIDTWAGGNTAKETLSALIKAAEVGKYPFEITICIDPWSMAGGTRQAAYEEAVLWLLKSHGESPNLARRHGKPFILTYQGQGIMAGAKRPALDSEVGWQALIDAYKAVEKAAGQPLCFYFDFSELLQGIQGGQNKKPNTEVLLEAAPHLARYFGAIGDFLELNGLTRNKEFMQKMSVAVRQAGAEWAPAIWYQYDNVSWHLENVDGTDKLRETWQRAIDQKATFMQFATWNDYGEHTSLAPTRATNYGIGALNRYYAQWWKTGKQPEAKEDQVFVTYRSSPAGAQSYPFTGSNRGSTLEVVTILTTPGKIKLGNVEEAVPAGLNVKKFPLPLGKLGVNLLRNGKIVQSVKGREEVTDKPCRPNATLYCTSSWDEAYWKEDFANSPYPEDDFNGDKDNDGLPNWFEMYWFGKWGDFTTATVAEPNADLDGDGKSNIEEYLERSNPTAKPAEYNAGYLWDMKDVHASMNPAPDSMGTLVWNYLFREGEKGEAVAHNGAYARMAYPRPGAIGYYADGRCHASIAWIKENNQPYLSFFGQNREWKGNCLVALGWTSPVTGVVDIEFKVVKVAGSGKEYANLSVEDDSNKALWKQSFELQATMEHPVSVKGIHVKKGEQLYIVDEGRAKVNLEFLKIILK